MARNHWKPRVVRIARLYTRYTSPVAFLARRFIQQTKQTVSGKVSVCVDVGSGTCPYAEEVKASSGATHYFAIDVAPSDRTDVIGDGCALPIATSSIDLVCSFDVLQHVPDVEKMLSEVNRVLKPGGFLMITFPFLYAECDFHDYQRWTMEGMDSMLKRHGFEVHFAKPRGGLFFAMFCGFVWFLNHLLPGQRRSWRAGHGMVGIARAALVALASLPGLVLAWLGLLIDNLGVVQGVYMGGAVLARKNTNANGFSAVCSC